MSVDLATALADYLDRPTAAHYLGVSPATLSSWAVSGRNRIPFKRYGRKCLYRKSDLDAFLTTQFQPVGK